MTKKEFIEYIKSLTSHVTFKYHGMDCGVDPLAIDEFDVWCGDTLVTVKNIKDVMSCRIFENNSLDEVFSDIINVE